jgi:hypothetical protein
MKKHKRIKITGKKSGVLAKFDKGNIVKLILPKVATMGINLISIGPRVILRSAFQIMRTNIWTRIISTLVIVSFDLYNFAKKKISKKQLAINLILSATLLIGGTTGWIFGTNSVTGIVAENTVLWIVAGLIGAGALSSISNSIGKKLLEKFVKSDVEDMIDLINEEFECIAKEYNLDNNKVDKIAEEIHIDHKICLDCFCKRDRKKYIREILCPYFEQAITTEK